MLSQRQRTFSGTEGGEKARHTQHRKTACILIINTKSRGGKKSGKCRVVRQWFEALWSRDSHISPGQLSWEGPATSAFEDIEGHAESARAHKMTGVLSPEAGELARAELCGMARKTLGRPI